MQARSAVADASECNCYIRPEVDMFSSWSFSEADKMQDAGKQAAELVVEQLRRDLKLNLPE